MTEIKKLFPQKMKINEMKLKALSYADLLGLMEMCAKLIPYYSQVKPDKTEANKFQLLAQAIDKEMKHRVNGLIVWLE